MSEIDLTALAEELSSLPKKEPPRRGRKSALDALESVLIGMRDKGYSDGEIADELSKRGIVVSAGTIKNRINKALRTGGGDGTKQSVAVAPSKPPATPAKGIRTSFDTKFADDEDEH